MTRSQFCAQSSLALVVRQLLDAVLAVDNLLRGPLLHGDIVAQLLADIYLSRAPDLCARRVECLFPMRHYTLSALCYHWG
jgi:hypothetical protein